MIIASFFVVSSAAEFQSVAKAVCRYRKAALTTASLGRSA